MSCCKSKTLLQTPDWRPLTELYYLLYIFQQRVILFSSYAAYFIALNTILKTLNCNQSRSINFQYEIPLTFIVTPTTLPCNFLWKFCLTFFLKVYKEILLMFNISLLYFFIYFFFFGYIKKWVTNCVNLSAMSNKFLFTRYDHFLSGYINFFA